MTNLNKKIAAVTLGAALTVTGLLGGLMLNNSAITASAEENIETVSSEGVAPAALCTLDAPTYEGADYTSHYCFATYGFMQDDDHTYQISFKQTESYQYDAFSLTAAKNVTVYYVVAPNVGSNTVTPTYKVCRVHCSECGAYSSYNTSLRSASGTLTRSSANIVGKTGTTTTIPTSFNKTGTTWTHGASTGDVIVFSIAYNGTVADRAVEVKSSSNTVDMTIGDVKFYVYTDSSKVSIRASKAVSCNMYNTMFAFKVL